MAVLFDTVERNLAARLLGSGEFDTGIESLDIALTLQFRTQYHLFGAGMGDVVRKVLLEDCVKFERRLERPVNGNGAGNGDIHLIRLLNKVIYNIKGILCYHMGQIDESARHLNRAKEINIDNIDYRKYLNLENLYYRGLCEGSSSIYVKELIEIIEDIPKESEGLTLHYLYLILEKLNKEVDKKKLVEQFPMRNSVTLLLLHFTKIMGEKEFLKLTQSVLEKSKFPQAKESDNGELESFHAFLPYFFKTQKTVSSEWHNFIISSMQRTFQSINVAKSAMIYFAKTEDTTQQSSRESVLNFVNYARYTEKHFVISGGTYEDVISLIDCYTFILGMANDESWNIENVFNAEETTNKLLQLLQYFYQEYKFPLMGNVDSLNWLENSSKLFLPRTISMILSNAWDTLYKVRSESLEHLLSNDLACYLGNAMCAAPKANNLVHLQFEYSYVLASQRHIDPAIKVLKTVLLEANPECYKAWHLLALCESIHENKEVSFKIVCSVLEAMRESLNEKKLQLVDRWQFVQLKLTQLSLIEELFGPLDASEMLPEVFELYSTLFPSDTHEFDRIGDQCKQTKEYLMQAIWIFAANLYARLSDRVNDAKKAIKEAIEVTNKFKNLNCDLAKGYLKLINGDFKAALSNFETVLFYDPLNVSALIGFAGIVFPEELNESEAAIWDYCHLKDSTGRATNTEHSTQDVFLSDLDKSAACARLKFLLEYAITKSIEAYHSPEVWWYLSNIYEKYEDQRYRDSLLNCIRYKESDPIRAFQYCNY